MNPRHHAQAGPGQSISYRLDPLILVSGPADANGVAAVASPRIPAGTAMLIDHAVCTNTSVLASRLDLWEDNVAAPSNRLSGTDSGNRDEADWSNGLQVGQSRRLVAVWTGCTPGAVGTLRLQVRDVRGES